MPAPAPTTSPAPDPIAVTTPPTVALPTAAQPTASLVVAGRSATGTTRLEPQPRAAGSPTSGIQVVDPADTALVNSSLEHLRRSATGSQLLGAVSAAGLRVQAMSDQQFEEQGHGVASAFYDTATDTMYVRRSELQAAPNRAALVIAHEMVHALDDIGGLGNGWLQQRLRSLAASGGGATPAAVEQVVWERSIASEARAHTVQGQVMRELGETDPTRMAGAVAIAANGTNDRATYDAVFRLLVSSEEGGYNPQHRTAEPFLM